MSATTTDLHPTDTHAEAAPAGPAAPLTGGLATASTLSAVLGVFLPLFGIIAASLVARRARIAGFSTRFPDLVMFWVAILMYFETLWLFTQLLGLLGHH
ncbi:hypothetical protein G3T36_15175 [Diaminobutyricibacter tongyongensis]|uniref:Uncharacterized protein n=1 Tax=Leifsonia tongyongensis TaxID=1268043 RepID=A0A6L9Y0M8_9MICO|nr:hypothetical protein [Diaminobutyricibacter tongyongensis]NEN07203.1 hypothetical protein [Diaminobutyricibacter tongyongensis]